MSSMLLVVVQKAKYAMFFVEVLLLNEKSNTPLAILFVIIVANMAFVVRFLRGILPVAQSARSLVKHLTLL